MTDGIGSAAWRQRRQQAYDQRAAGVVEAHGRTTPEARAAHQRIVAEIDALPVAEGGRAVDPGDQPPAGLEIVGDVVVARPPEAAPSPPPWPWWRRWWTRWTRR